MFKTLATIFSIADLRSKILFTIAMLIVFRIGSHITVPGINFQVLDDYFKASAGDAPGLTDYIDLFAGGAFKRLSIFALGIMPYISASIIMQLMMVVVPSLQKLSKEGEYGRRKINQFTRYGTVLLCAMQSYGITVYIQSLHDQIRNEKAISLIEGGGGMGFVLLTILAITTGTIVLMWLGELITEKGIGNGISLLIFAGIIAGAPPAIASFWSDVRNNTADVDMILVLILFIAFIAMIAMSILLTEGQRKIPLQFGKKIVGRKMMQGASQSLPIKVNAANVMPIIFASSLMLFPTQIANYLEGNYKEFAGAIQAYLSPGSWTYLLIYVVLIIFFAYFYTAIQYNPKDMAEALKKNGGYIPNVRPGQPTEEKIQHIMNRITLSGAIFLAFIAIAPDLMIQIWDLQKYRNLAYLFGGTSLLITVGVALDTLKQIESQLVMRHYSGFMDKSKKSSGKARMVR
ncbi:MAG: preprotein translocase subunit SecY [Leptospiraceae bacterium]|nr:preprotein translocase subunit SecY [Leptospiraceae bacterium]MCB1202055.1 preprotein translocase subunit SecY [Leptospiraceae bacterium]